MASVSEDAAPTPPTGGGAKKFPPAAPFSRTGLMLRIHGGSQARASVSSDVCSDGISWSRTCKLPGKLPGGNFRVISTPCEKTCCNPLGRIGLRSQLKTLPPPPTERRCW